MIKHCILLCHYITKFECPYLLYNQSIERMYNLMKKAIKYVCSFCEPFYTKVKQTFDQAKEVLQVRSSIMVKLGLDEIILDREDQPKLKRIEDSVLQDIQYYSTGLEEQFEVQWKQYHAQMIEPFSKQQARIMIPHYTNDTCYADISSVIGSFM